MLKTTGLFLLLATAAAAAERATYDAGGALTSLISGGVELPVHGDLRVKFTGAPYVTAQPGDQRSPITREGLEEKWQGSAAYPNGAHTDVSVAWDESDAGVALNASLASKPLFPGAAAARFPIDIDSVDYVLDLPRSAFAGWRLGASNTPLPASKPENPTFFDETTGNLALSDAGGGLRLELALDQPRRVRITDVWDGSGRYYRVRISVHSGAWMSGDTLKIGFTMKLTGTSAGASAHLSVDPKDALYPFDGFGGNFRIYTETPVADYCLRNLKVSWARIEFKAITWDHDRTQAAPSPPLARDFELMQRFQKAGIPWVLSLWFLPERFYTDPNQKPFGTFARQIAPDRWPEFLDLLGSYLVYLKQHYGAEPDLFSFNESDLGVNIGFTAETHRDEIKRIGAHLASLGLKTKMLLGDTANPRDSHMFTLAAAADPEAMRYVGAVSVHSWGNGTPAQYQAWGDVGQWLKLPLLVAEAGVDPGAFKNHAFDSYSYGLKEAAQFQDLLRYARPQALIYWQFTDDYGLVHVGPDGAITPTGRFWLMKQFVNLSPTKSHVVRSSSDQPDVQVSAFGAGDSLVVHILNLGPGRKATVAGLGGSWHAFTTTEESGYQEAPVVPGADPSGQPLELPARSLVTLVRQ